MHHIPWCLIRVWVFTFLLVVISVVFSFESSDTEETSEQRMCYEKLKSLSFTGGEEEEASRPRVKWTGLQLSTRTDARLSSPSQHVTVQCTQNARATVCDVTRKKRQSRRRSTFPVVNASEIESSTRENSSASLFLFHCVDIPRFFFLSLFTSHSQTQLNVNSKWTE